MARSMPAGLAAALIGLCAAGAWGVPILDGSVDPGEYDYVLPDDPNDNDAGVYETGLDIDAVHITVEPNDLYVGLTTDTAFDYDGSDANSWGQTWVKMRFYENGAAPTLKHSLVMMVVGDPNSFALWMDGSIGVEGTNYWAKVGDAFEFRIDREELMPDLGDRFAFDVLLDDMGEDMDDYLFAYVPEPATAALLTLGLSAILLRRRRA